MATENKYDSSVRGLNFCSKVYNNMQAHKKFKLDFDWRLQQLKCINNMDSCYIHLQLYYFDHYKTKRENINPKGSTHFPKGKY